MPTTELTFYFRATEVYRESDGHLMLIVEVTTASGKLARLAVIDPRDYED